MNYTKEFSGDIPIYNSWLCGLSSDETISALKYECKMKRKKYMKNCILTFFKVVVQKERIARNVDGFFSIYFNSKTQYYTSLHKVLEVCKEKNLYINKFKVRNNYK